MKNLVSVLKRLLVAILIFGALALIFNNYSLVFAKKVTGEVLEIDRVTQPNAIIGSSTPASAMYSFAIAVKQPDGTIYTASSEDRQFAVIRKGNCIEAKFFPYPPWELDKADTYFNARLIRLFECPPGAQASNTQPSATPIEVATPALTQSPSSSPVPSSATQAH